MNPCAISQTVVDAGPVLLRVTPRPGVPTPGSLGERAARVPRPLQSAAGTGRPGRRCRFTNYKVDVYVEKREVEKPFPNRGWGLQSRQKLVFFSVVFLRKK